jgi:hypothetical protein
MISLNGVTLSEDLLWENEFDNPGISQNTKRTLLGNLVIQNMPLSAGRVINLTAVSEGNSYSGFFTREQVIEFKRLEELGASMIFHYEGTDYNVTIMAGGVQVSPIQPRPNQDTTDLYSGVLILIEL